MRIEYEKKDIPLTVDIMKVKLKDVTDKDEAIKIIMEHNYCNEHTAQQHLKKVKPEITSQYCSKAECETIGNLAYLAMAINDVARLETLRKELGITPIPLKEQVQNRKAFLAYKKTDEYKKVISEVRK